MAGKYKDSTNTSEATGAPNTPRALWTHTIAGNTVSPDGQALGVHIEALGSGGSGISGEVWATLRGVEVFRESVTGNGTKLVVDLDIWKRGTTMGDVSGREAIRDIGGGSVDGVLPDKALTGLAWGSSQDLVIYGQSNTTGGIVLQRAGVVR